ncbi:MAG: hypothetical protein GXO83_02635 [Chlorobi bacterium]|nr:hypothetical protein [Chlorobiota bacterium]
MIRLLNITVLRLPILSILLFNPTLIYAQQSTTISKPELVFRNDTLIIKYNFDHCKNEELYNVWIEAATMDGKKLSAQSLTGDIGNEIICDTDKIIYWDLIGDSLFLDDVISVKVKATASDQRHAQKNKDPSYILSSLIFPGSGLVLLKQNNKPYWIMGIVGYMGIASTLHFYQAAKNDYQDFQQEEDLVQQQQFFESYKNNQKIMRISAISTGSLWLTNLIWTITSPRHKSMNIAFKNNSVRIGAVTMPGSFTSGIIIKYEF